VKDFPAIVDRLHAAYCRYAGISVRLRDNVTRLWSDLLKDYDDDDARLEADLKIVIVYLRAQIQRDKRNPGSLKLANLLQPEQFEADLAEAKLLRGRRVNTAPTTAVQSLPDGTRRQIDNPIQDEPETPTREAALAQLEAWRKQQR
jgi:hypothetical protein